MTLPQSVLISTFVEPEHVQAIELAFPGLQVLYEPDLLPVPRYVADHGGTKRTLSPAEQAKWEGLLAQAEVALDFDWQLPKRLVQRAPRLRWVQATSAGVGGFMSRTGLGDSELVVTTAAGVHAQPLSEFAVAGALHFIKGFDDLRERKSRKDWRRFTSAQLAGRTVTVVGLGAVGMRTVRSFSTLGADVVAVGRPGGTYDLGENVRSATTDDLATVLPDTDVLVLCCALTPATEGLIGEGEIGMLPAGAIVVNISRGQVVNEAALVDALTSRHLLGACLDVFATEPLPELSPLWALENVVISPHSASTVTTENAAITALFIDNLSRWSQGRPLLNTYEVARGY